MIGIGRLALGFGEMWEQTVINTCVIAHVGKHERFARCPSVVTSDEPRQTLGAVELHGFSVDSVNQLTFGNQRKREAAAGKVNGQVGPFLQVAAVEARSFPPTADAVRQGGPARIFVQQCVEPGFQQGADFGFISTAKNIGMPGGQVVPCAG